MAEDGLFFRPRYVGFGFTYDNTDESGRMIVETIVPDSPAAEFGKYIALPKTQNLYLTT